MPASSGTSQNDTIVGTDLADTIYGGAGGDELFGGVGDDALFGGSDPNDVTRLPLGSGTVDPTLTTQVPDAIRPDATAIRFDSSFSLAENADIVHATQQPHATYHATGRDLFDYYAVDLLAGEQITLDIDGGAETGASSVDIYLRVYDGEGQLVGSNDDAQNSLGAGGSAGFLDSFLTLKTDVAGTYFIEAAEFNHNPVPVGSTYTMHMSVQDVEDDARDTLRGEAGDDTLDGGLGNDILYGGDGQDHALGGDGDDQIFGGADADSIEGGNGYDLLYGGDGDDVIFGSSAGEGSQDDLSDEIRGGNGNDRAYGGYGNDYLSGAADNDTLEGGHGVDTIAGNSGNDVLSGGVWSDLLFGGLGADFLNGGYGNDRLNGGDGADRFFHLGIANHGTDWIRDYDADEGDVLQFGGSSASQSDFLLQRASSPGTGEAEIDEAYITYVPDGLILWALVDGGAQSAIKVMVAGETFELFG